MASSKLTLSVKSDSVSLIKNYAKRQQTSVSKLVQDFFDSIAEKDNAVLEKYKNLPVSDEIRALTGIAKGKYPDETTLSDIKHEYLKEKYDL